MPENPLQPNADHPQGPGQNETPPAQAPTPSGGARTTTTTTTTTPDPAAKDDPRAEQQKREQVVKDQEQPQEGAKTEPTPMEDPAETLKGYRAKR